MAKGITGVCRRMSAIALMGLSACCAEKPPQAPVDLAGLDEIRIDYEHMGWGSVEEHFTITPIPGQEDFLLRGRYEADRGRQVEVEIPLPVEKVQVFLTHLESDAWPRTKGVQALVQHIDRAALRQFEPVSRMPPSRCSDEELHYLARRHLGQASIASLVDSHYGRGISWTDDYPFALVQVRWRNRPAFVMSSRSQKALMLPWNVGVPVDSPPPSSENWSLPVSRSLQALLPPASHLHERLDGMTRMERPLSRAAMHEAERQCDVARPRRNGGDGLPSH